MDDKQEPLQVGDIISLYSGPKAQSAPLPGAMKVIKIIDTEHGVFHNTEYNRQYPNGGVWEVGYGFHAQGWEWKLIQRYAWNVPIQTIETMSNEAINDHICPTCRNDRCSKTEKSCWVCGGKLQ